MAPQRVEETEAACSARPRTAAWPSTRAPPSRGGACRVVTMSRVGKDESVVLLASILQNSNETMEARIAACDAVHALNPNPAP